MRRDASDLIAPLPQLFETRRPTGRPGVRVRRAATLNLPAAIT
jgi:hypothetical protein